MIVAESHDFEGFTPGTIAVPPIQYDHVEQLRTALNAVRAANGDPALSWPQLLVGANTAPTPGHNVGIYAAHIRALRSEVTAALGRLCPAGSSCGFATQPSFTDPTLTTSPPVFIKAIHFTQLQDVVR